MLSTLVVFVNRRIHGGLKTFPEQSPVFVRYAKMLENDEVLKTVTDPARRIFFKNLGKIGLGAAASGLAMSSLSPLLKAQSTTAIIDPFVDRSFGHRFDAAASWIGRLSTSSIDGTKLVCHRDC
jgi:hypothetical protein